MQDVFVVGSALIRLDIIGRFIEFLRLDKALGILRSVSKAAPAGVGRLRLIKSQCRELLPLLRRK